MSEQLVGHDLLELGLRDVDHGSTRVVLGGCHAELQYFLIAVVTPTTHPRQNYVFELGTEAEAFGNFEAVA